MHSRIFQVSKTPIKKDDYISSCDYEDHWFTKRIADYVSDSCDRMSDIEWLASNNLTIDKIGEDEVIVVCSKETFFEKTYLRFADAVKKIQNMALDEFCSSTRSYDVWSVKDAYEEKYGFYIDDDGDLMTLFDWVRFVDINTPYYIGGTVDYHS